MNSYLDFLKVLLTLGPKLPALLAQVQKIIAEVKTLIGLAVPAESAGELAVFAPDAEAETLEGQVAASLAAAGSQALFDGSVLRSAWTFINQHPELLSLLLGILSKAKG